MILRFTKRNGEYYDMTFKNDEEKTKYIASFPPKYFWKIRVIKI